MYQHPIHNLLPQSHFKETKHKENREEINKLKVLHVSIKFEKPESQTSTVATVLYIVQIFCNLLNATANHNVSNKKIAARLLFSAFLNLPSMLQEDQSEERRKVNMIDSITQKVGLLSGIKPASFGKQS